MNVPNKRFKNLLPKFNYSRSIIEELGVNVILTDQDDENNLDLYCYTKCSNEDDNNLKKCRGIVYHENQVVMTGFPYTDEYNDTEHDKILEKIGDVINKLVIYKAYEGTLIRVFNFNNKWYISTHRKLDAFRSKWSSNESFGESFKKAIESEYYNNISFNNFIRNNMMIEEDISIDIFELFKYKLDINKHYMFLIRNNIDNKIVCTPPDKPTLYHVGTFCNGELSLADNSIYISKPERLYFNSYIRLLDYVKNIDPLVSPGIIGFIGDRQVKILNKKYQEYFLLRGNEPSINFRYLQLRHSPEAVVTFSFLYPHRKEKFVEYENILTNVCINLYKLYKDRYINKNISILSKEDNILIKECHRLYTNKTVPYVTLEVVRYTLNKQSCIILNHLIRYYIHSIR